MSFFRLLFGRRFASSEEKKEKLTLMTGVPLLGLDALSSTAYGPEAALAILLPLGAIGLHYFPLVILGVVILLIILYCSYRQTIGAYPHGGGAYIVAGENLGKRVGLWAAVALLLDYLLNVAVGISAGVGAAISAFPALHHHTLNITLFVLVTLTILNLRGVKQSGLVFIVPTITFVLCIAIAIGIGVAKSLLNGGHPQAVIEPSTMPVLTSNVTIWLLLGAFANGLTAMTGVEAVSNAIPLFKRPTVLNARRTLRAIVIILTLFLLGLAYLCPAYQITAMDESKPGYQTILSQLIGAVTGQGIFYYIAMASIFIVLTYSAQTSFAAFPRVCRLLAEDGYLPNFFSEKGRRLVYTPGIVVLAILSGLLLIIFKGITTALIPLFAIGAFSAFCFSQAGMVVFWHRKRNAKTKLAINALGAISTAIALIIIVVEKFLEGGWIIIVVAPLLYLLFSQIKRHYQHVARQIKHPFKTSFIKVKLKSPIVIIPIEGWDQVFERALKIGMLVSEDITAVHISTEKDETKQPLRKTWEEMIVRAAIEANVPVPKLIVIQSPYRRINKPILDFIYKTKKENPDRVIAVVIPELVEPHWYEYLLHNIHAAELKSILFLAKDPQIVVIHSPWYLPDYIDDKE
jgi:amino acid transporter